jgi:signal transduction histidine kinase
MTPIWSMRRWLVTALVLVAVLSFLAFFVIAIILPAIGLLGDGTDGRSGEIAWDQVALMLLLLLVSVTLSSAAAVALLRRVFVAPLGALASAAREVQAGNLDVHLPQARVQELADVLDGFHGMAEGLRSSIVRQAALEEDRRFFLAAISHDLRTPLFALRGRLEGLRDGLAATPEQEQRYLAGALRSLDGLDRLVADLFAYSRLKLLEQEPEMAPIDLADVVRQVVEAAEPRAAAKEVLLEVVGSGPCPLAGDAFLLGRALGNLVENAITHTPASGCVRVGWGARGANVEAWVEDDGPGIPPELLPHLFAPLRRGDLHRPRSGGGSGLGLAIARSVVEAHGGHVEGSNREGRGARFCVVLQGR